jgi:IS4 transposase
MPSLLIADNTFENILQELPAGTVSMAREFRAFARSRAVRTPEELLRAVLLYCGLDYSLREVAANFTQVGRRLSDEAIRGRLSACEPWLEAMLQEMLPKPDVEIAQYSNRLILVDGTRVLAPGATSFDYFLHLGWDWMQQRVVHMEVTDFRTGESLKLYDWRSGDVALADAGYAKAPQLKAVTEKGAEFVVRCSPTSIRMLLETGEKLNIAHELRKHNSERLVTLPVRIDSGNNSQNAYLHAFRLSEAAAQRARRKVHRRATKASRKTAGADTLYLSEWIIILTSFSPEQISAESIGKIYRARWQVELVIKRLKSILNLDALRARRGSRLAQVYLLGKSLYALMIETRALKLSRTRDVEWRVWRMVANQIRTWITLSHLIAPDINREVLKVLKERPRRRKRLRAKIAQIVKELKLKPLPLNNLYA